MTNEQAVHYMQLEREILELAPDGWIAREMNNMLRRRDLAKDWREHVVEYHEIGPYLVCELADNNFGRFRVLVDGKNLGRRYGSMEEAILGALFHRVDSQGRAAECAYAMLRGLALPREGKL